MSIVFIRFLITMDTAGGVTTPAPLRRHTADAVIDRGFDQAPRIPGSSLAGALRSRFSAVHGRAATRRVFGHLDDDDGAAIAMAAGDPRSPGPVHVSPDFPALDQDPGGPSGQTSGEAGGPGSLWVYDAPAVTATVTTTTRTAVDRRRGAAASHALTTLERVDGGTTFHAYLRWDDPAERDLVDLWAALAGWTPRLGRGTSAGAGACTLGEVRHGRLDLSDTDDLLTWLTLSGPDLVDHVAATPARLPDPTGLPAQVRITFRVAGPLSVTAGAQQENRQENRQEPAPPAGQPGQERRNLLRVYRENGRPVIPGSTIKGVVRARTEYILRSVGVPVCGEIEGAGPCGRCLTCTLFGYGGSSGEHRHAVGARGRAIPSTAVIGPLPPDHAPVLRVRPRVSIDRFTGGSANRTVTAARIVLAGERQGRLFSVEAVERGLFEMVWDVSALDTAQTLDFSALLRLVCDDFADGLTGLGHATTAGYGWVDPDLRQLDALMPRPAAQQRLSAIVARGTAGADEVNG